MKCNFCRKDLWHCVQPIPFLFPSPFSISIVEKPSGQLPGQSVVGREGIVGMCTNEVRNIFWISSAFSANIQSIFHAIALTSSS